MNIYPESAPGKGSLRCIAALLLLLLAVSIAEGAGEARTLALEECIRLAEEHHPSLEEARASLNAQKARLDAVKAGNALTGSLSASTGRQTGSDQSYSTSFTVTKLLSDSGKNALERRSQGLAIDTASESQREAVLTVRKGVKDAYYTLLLNGLKREQAESAVRTYEKHLEKAKGFYEAGAKAKFDVTKAEVDLSNAILNRIRAENALRITRVNLNNAMGIPDIPEYVIDETLLPETYAIDLPSALEKAYAVRPDLQSVKKQVEAAEAAVNLAKKGYYPYLTGNAGYGFGGGDFPLGEGWNVGAALNVPVFNGLETRYSVEEARASLDVVKAQEQTLLQQVRLEVEEAFSNLREAEERTVAAQMAVRQAEENVELATGRYDAGVGNPIEVTDALVSLSNARTNYIAALTDARIARAELEKATGLR